MGGVVTKNVEGNSSNIALYEEAFVTSDCTNCSGHSPGPYHMMPCAVRSQFIQMTFIFQ